MNDFVLIRKNLFRKKLRAELDDRIDHRLPSRSSACSPRSNAPSTPARMSPHADRLVVVNKINFTQPLPIAYCEPRPRHRRRAPPHPRQLVRRLFPGPEELPDRVRGRAGDLHGPLQRRPGFSAGGAARLHPRSLGGAMVGETLARKWGWKVGDHIPISEPDLLAEERRPHLGLHHRRHLHQPHGCTSTPIS